MKGKRLSAALAASLAVVAIGSGTAAATGAFSSSHDASTEKAVKTALRGKEPRNVIFLLGDGMGTQEITAARYYQGVAAPLNVDRMPLTGFDTTWSVKPAAAVSVPARLRPRLRLDRDGLGDRPENARRAHLAGPEQRHRRARPEPQDGARDGAEKGHDGRRRLDRGDHRRDAGGARFAHLPARLPGPGRHGCLPDRRPRAPAGSARSPSRRSTTRSTCSWAAAAPASRRRSAAARTPARR